MNINLKLILETADQLLNDADQAHKEKTGIQRKRNVRDTEIASQMIIGAILSYHGQLRDNLLGKGIDIGEMVYIDYPNELKKQFSQISYISPEDNA